MENVSQEQIDKMVEESKHRNEDSFENKGEVESQIENDDDLLNVSDSNFSSDDSMRPCNIIKRRSAEKLAKQKEREVIEILPVLKLDEKLEKFPEPIEEIAERVEEKKPKREMLEESDEEEKRELQTEPEKREDPKVELEPTEEKEDDVIME